MVNAELHLETVLGLAFGTRHNACAQKRRRITVRVDTTPSDLRGFRAFPLKRAKYIVNVSIIRFCFSQNAQIITIIRHNRAPMYLLLIGKLELKTEYPYRVTDVVSIG